jgi:anti-sigma factor RsiW
VMHPDTELTGYVTESLEPATRATVAAHLRGCADCRRIVEESRAVLADLAAAVPPAPPLDWGRYQADVRTRVEARGRRAWWARPLPAVLAAGMATATVLLVLHALDRRPAELAAVEEAMLGARLPLLQQYQVVERLELLEDLEAIRHLERLGSGGS